ncbi:hypothetical protein HanHA89_Chr04g0168311 [Helianthus annuus]|nr:hypothetical protein HanHA89_Chr04g0168311 [Helianthus annuus]
MVVYHFMTISFRKYFRVLVMKPFGDILDVPNTHALVQPFKVGFIHVRLITHSISYIDYSKPFLFAYGRLDDCGKRPE